MSAVIQMLQHMVAALAVAAFAHFGVSLKDAPRPNPGPTVQRIAYLRPVVPRTIGRAAPPLAKDLRRA